MIKLWALSAGILACIAVIAALLARRRRSTGDFMAEPLSTEWLAQARSREEHGW
jgi:hypothetical protein